MTEVSSTVPMMNESTNESEVQQLSGEFGVVEILEKLGMPFEKNRSNLYNKKRWEDCEKNDSLLMIPTVDTSKLILFQCGRKLWKNEDNNAIYLSFVSHLSPVNDLTFLENFTEISRILINIPLNEYERLKNISNSWIDLVVAGGQICRYEFPTLEKEVMMLEAVTKKVPTDPSKFPDSSFVVDNETVTFDIMTHSLHNYPLFYSDWGHIFGVQCSHTISGMTIKLVGKSLDQDQIDAVKPPSKLDASGTLIKPGLPSFAVLPPFETFFHDVLRERRGPMTISFKNEKWVRFDSAPYRLTDIFIIPQDATMIPRVKNVRCSYGQASSTRLPVGVIEHEELALSDADRLQTCFESNMIFYPEVGGWRLKAVPTFTDEDGTNPKKCFSIYHDLCIYLRLDFEKSETDSEPFEVTANVFQIGINVVRFRCGAIARGYCC